MPTVSADALHRVPILLVDDRFMGVLKHNLLFFRDFIALFQLVGLGVGLEIDRVSQIFLVGQDFIYTSIYPYELLARTVIAL